MGRRARRRDATGQPTGGPTRAERDAARERRAAGAARADRPPRGRSTTARRPDPAWGRFPLTELVILLALVLAAMGLLGGLDTARGRIMFAAGLVLGMLGGLELTIREHFGGYRSHTTLLSLAVAVAAIVAVQFALSALAPTLTPAVLLVVALAVAAPLFTVCFVALRRVFQRRSGGLSFR